jgi:hypothetical protein
MCAAAASLDEVVEEFLGASVHPGLPAGFPAVALPADLQLRVLGTMVASGIEQVLLETPDMLRASAALRAAYVHAGWTDLGGGSVLVLLCHAAHGALQISPATRVPGRLRVLHSRDNIFAGDPVAAANCGGVPQGNGTAWSSWFLAQLPVLPVPPQTHPINTSVFTPSPVPGIVTARSAGNGALELTVNAEQKNIIGVANIDIAGLDAHFAARLTELGWTRDSRGSGLLSATSVWYRTAVVPEGIAMEAQDVVLAGTLTLQLLQDAEFYINFNMQGTIGLPASNLVPTGCAPLNDPSLGIRDVPAGISSGSRICRP